MSFYVTACCLSGVTAVFTMLSAWTTDKRKSFGFQTAQCLTYAAASWFYGVYPAVFSMILCAVRNYLVAKEKYTMRASVTLTLAVAVIGFASNTSGFLGLIPVFATMEYGVLLSLFRGKVSTRVNVLVNLALWVSYDFMIRDFINFTVDSVSVILALISIIRVLQSATREQTT